MSEDFLSRWSQRKRAAEAEKPVAPDAGQNEKNPAADDRSQPPEFDISTLPPIDSITAISDVTAFLRAGVPAELTRAALRRVWTADTSIRDFKGLAENAWDFTAPDAMHGFGPLDYTPERISEMVQRVFGEVDQAIAATPSAKTEAESAAVPSNSDESVGQISEEAEEADAVEPPAPAQMSDNRVAGTVSDEREPEGIVHRTHGSALPR